MSSSADHTEETRVQVLFDAVRDVVGEDGVSTIQDRFGGSHVRVGTSPGEDKWLPTLFGLEKARRICAACCIIDADNRFRTVVGKIVIPHGFKGLLARTAARADRLLLDGQPVSKIARQLGMHERTIWRRRAKLVADGKLKTWHKP